MSHLDTAGSPELGGEDVTAAGFKDAERLEFVFMWDPRCCSTVDCLGAEYTGWWFLENQCLLGLVVSRAQTLA